MLLNGISLVSIAGGRISVGVLGKEVLMRQQLNFTGILSADPITQGKHVFLGLCSGNGHGTFRGQEDISQQGPKQLGLVSVIKRMLRGDKTSLQKHCRRNTPERKKRTKLALL